MLFTSLTHARIVILSPWTMPQLTLHFVIRYQMLILPCVAQSFPRIPLQSSHVCLTQLCAQKFGYFCCGAF